MTKEKTTKAKKNPSNITIVDGKLILSLPNAQMPVVWQTDLTNAQSASFTIKEDKKKKAFILISKAQDGSIDEIASFDDKQSSVDILMEISKILQNAHGKIKPLNNVVSNNNNLQVPSAVNNSKDNKIGAITALILIIILIIIWMASASNSINMKEQNVTYSNSSTSNNNSPASSGVPVSADDFLSNR